MEQLLRERFGHRRHASRARCAAQVPDALRQQRDESDDELRITDKYRGVVRRETRAERPHLPDEVALLPSIGMPD